MSAKFYPAKSSEGWPWYSELPDREFDADMRDWSISEKPWVMIMNDNEMAPKIIDLAVRVREVFSQNSQLRLLCEEEPINSIEPN